VCGHTAYLALDGGSGRRARPLRTRRESWCGRTGCTAALVGDPGTAASDGPADGDDDRREERDTSELDDDSGSDGIRPEQRSDGDDLGHLVGGGTGEQATAVDVHRQEPDEQGDQRDHQRPEEDDEGDGGRDVLVLAVDGPLDRGDGRRATDREAGGDEQPLSHGHPRESPNGQRAEDPAADDGHDDDQHARAEGGDLWKKNMEFSTGKADSVPFSVVQNDCGK
jgi:hypothetical protein